MVVGIRQLVDAARAACIIINTTGLVHGVGQVLKSYKIETIQPHVVVAIETGQELRSLLAAYGNFRLLRIPPSPRAITKTPEQRRLARERAFRDYFQLATEVTLPVKRLLFQRRIVPHARETHVLCGVADRRNRGLGLAIISGREVQQGTVSLLTPVPAEAIHIVQYGDLYLAPDGRALYDG
jgi:polynucleotide 5'-hydroxyl-kinase GRC3/NOL9